jgi:hypothetical protein
MQAIVLTSVKRERLTPGEASPNLTTMSPSLDELRLHLERVLNLSLTPIEDLKVLTGRWEMRYGGPVGNDELQYVYKFRPEGKLSIGDDDRGTWRLIDRATLIVGFPHEADPAFDLEAGITEELRYAFASGEGRALLCNEDTSLVEHLTQLK